MKSKPLGIEFSNGFDSEPTDCDAIFSIVQTCLHSSLSIHVVQNSFSLTLYNNNVLILSMYIVRVIIINDRSLWPFLASWFLCICVRMQLPLPQRLWTSLFKF